MKDTKSYYRYGGVKTDLHARVVSTNDVPIPGLWAAGEMTGLFYNEYPPATSCLRSMTFGRLAGLEIARNLGREQSQIGGQTVKQEVSHRPKDSVTMDQDVLSQEGKNAIKVSQWSRDVLSCVCQGMESQVTYDLPRSALS